MRQLQMHCAFIYQWLDPKKERGHVGSLTSTLQNYVPEKCTENLFKQLILHAYNLFTLLMNIHLPLNKNVPFHSVQIESIPMNNRQIACVVFLVCPQAFRSLSIFLLWTFNSWIALARASETTGSWESQRHSVERGHQNNLVISVYQK